MSAKRPRSISSPIFCSFTIRNMTAKTNKLFLQVKYDRKKQTSMSDYVDNKSACKWCQQYIH